MAKLGSLFDGAGTMPYAAKLSGIEPVWSSEIESFPLKVTAKRFPNVTQLGDITKIDGRKIEPVDVITFGSPCQDLSIAGKRAGLDGERSGLFMEAVRIIKEMRDETSTGTDESVRPRFAVWENVPGAFSSNKGEDFRVVLEEMCKIKDGNAAIPRPKNWKWNTAGLIVGNGYSVAWRVLDARFWGVPQRRRRIWLVADFGGERAGEILFKRAGLRRGFASGRAPREEVARDFGNGAQASDRKIYDARGNGDGNISPTITGDHNGRITDYTAVICQNFIANSSGDGFATTLDANYYKGLGARSGKEREYVVCYQETIDRHAIAYEGKPQYIVRRLTPLECCRLQGMPDWWCADVPHSDAPEYKMWGNGMALPCAMYVMEGIAEIYEEEKNANRIV